jgi:arsenate reductase
LPPTKVTFVCVQNAGRSQMAAAFAERERERRGAEHRQVEIVTGGTDPADHVHDEVVEVMQEVGIDLSDRTPREVTSEELQDCNYVITMGCSAEDACPATWSGENRDWELDDPDGRNPDAVRAIRDEVERRVEAFFEELED